MKLTSKIMQEADINRVIPLYMDYYNAHENGQWSLEATYKRIHQVWSREDSMCLLFEKEGTLIGFGMGYFEQYDDLKAYDLIEIVIDYPYQNKGYGTACMMELETRIKLAGGAMIQLQAVKDEMHEHFYGKLQYQDVRNLVLKTKWL